MKLWIKWEQLDITALLEAVEVRQYMETRRHERLSKKQARQKELERLNQGKSTLKTLFSSSDGKVNRITVLTRKIATGEKEIECLDLYLRILALQLNQAAIPNFKRDKVAIYNDLLNTYSAQHIYNTQGLTECYQMIIKANHVFKDNEPQVMTKSIHQLE